METQPMQSAPQIPPQVKALERERNEALAIVLNNVREKRVEMGELTSVVTYGREYPLRAGSVPDRVVAEAQALHNACEMVCREAQERGDYRGEQAAAKLSELLNENELLTSRYAEFLEHFPSLASEIKKMLPSLSSDTSVENDGKYLVH